MAPAQSRLALVHPPVDGTPSHANGLAALWAGVDRLIDRAPGIPDLFEHGMHLLAARRWRSLGRPVPPELQKEERFAAIKTLVGPLLLEQIRELYDGRIVLIKGPEVAARYPDPALRPLTDIDLLVEDPAAAQRALLSAGFREIGDKSLFVDIHHLSPLLSPTLPMAVEIHLFPKWIEGLAPPSARELLDVSVASTVGIEGIHTLPPTHHALLLVAHSWAHEPLRRLIELVDIAAVSADADPRELEDLSQRWGLKRAWRTTEAAADALFFRRRAAPMVLRLWARNLPAARGRTVLESHFEHWISGFWALPAGQAVRRGAAALGREFRPAVDETWRAKFGRTGLAIRNAFVRRSQHEHALGKREEPGSPPR